MDNMNTAAATLVTIKITHDAIRVLGLDDPGRYTDLRRAGSDGRFQWLEGERDAVQSLLNELFDRADPNDGYHESPADRAICNRAIARITKLTGFMPTR
jgi:hypothetical protein